MFEANVAKIILFAVYLVKIEFIVSSTHDSDFENPGTIALVDSLNNNLTPSLPSLAIL